MDTYNHNLANKDVLSQAGSYMDAEHELYLQSLIDDAYGYYLEVDECTSRSEFTAMYERVLELLQPILKDFPLLPLDLLVRDSDDRAAMLNLEAWDLIDGMRSTFYDREEAGTWPKADLT